MGDFDTIDVPGGSPLKMWTKNVLIEDVAIKQMQNVAMPYLSALVRFNN